jgi:DNA polymerase-3 subunit epsilon/CBS domain-containing protein
MPLSALRAVVLDTETTGLDARVARIVQIGALRVDGSVILEADVFDQLVNPGVPIPAATTAVHGLSDADVASAPTFPHVAAKLQAFVGGDVVVGHTIAYDAAVLAREHALASLPPPRWRLLDVRALAELAMPTLAQYDLDRIAAALGVVVTGRHTALGDARTTAEIFCRLLPALRERGIRTLAELETASRDLADRQAAAGRAPTSLQAPATDQRAALRRIDSFPYRHRLSDIMSSPVIVPAAQSIRTTLATLLERKVSSVLAAAADGRIGIATERDLLRALHGGGADALDRPVGEIMSHPLQTLRADDFVYRAIGRIERLGIRHLGVIDAAGAIVGVVTTRNLLRHRATTAIVLGDEIDAAATPADLARAWSRLPTMAESLLAEDVDPRTIANVVSTEVCALTARAAAFAEAEMQAAGRGTSQVPYAVLVLGSAGRGESLLAADQDNAIVFADGAPDSETDRWFAAMGERMNRILDEAGIPLCKGGIMARNAAWRGSVATWRARIDGWVRRQRPADLLNVDIFFDAIAVAGDTALADGVLDHAYAVAKTAKDFQLQLSLASRPGGRLPVTLFGALKGDQEGRLDLKRHGLMPLFTTARLLAIREGVRARGTPQRLAAALPTAQDQVDAYSEAHATVMRAMLTQQVLDGEAGRPLSPRVEIARLTSTERDELKRSLRLIEGAFDLVTEGRV